MKRETNLLWVLGITVVGGILVSPFTTKDVFEAPGWIAVREAMSGKDGLTVLLILGSASIFGGLYLWDVAKARRSARLEGPPLIPEVPPVDTAPPPSKSHLIGAFPFFAALLGNKRKEEPLPFLPSTLAGMLTLKLEAHAELRKREPVFSDRFRAEARLTLSELHTYGIPTPPFHGRAKKDLERLVSYIDTLMPALRARNFELAIREAGNWMRRNQLVGLR